MTRTKNFGIARLAVPAVLAAGLAIGGARAADQAEQSLRSEALALNNLTGTDVIDAKLRLLVGDEERTKKLLKVAEEMARDKEQPFNFNAAIILAKAAQVLKDTDASKFFYKLCAQEALKLQSSYKLIQVYDGLIDLHFASNQFDEAVKVCQEFMELRGERINRVKPFVMERMIQAKAKQGKIDEALKLTEGLIEADEGGWYFVQLKGWVLREAGKLEESAETYLDVIKRLRRADLEEEERERFADRVRYLLSGLYVDMKQIDKAAEQLQILLKKHPNNATYNNDLGYIWADHNMNLDESERLIRKAIEEDEKERKALDLPPELNKPNAAYLDSLGWVLYRKGKFEEAKKYLQQAAELPEGQHIEILDHLADVHIQLGETKQAVEIWEKALKLENLTPREQKRREEVQKKLDKYKQAE